MFVSQMSVGRNVRRRNVTEYESNSVVVYLNNSRQTRIIQESFERLQPKNGSKQLIKIWEAPP